MEDSFISTPWLNPLRDLHLAPINPVIYGGTMGISNLEARFTLEMLSVFID